MRYALDLQHFNFSSFLEDVHSHLCMNNQENQPVMCQENFVYKSYFVEFIGTCISLIAK
jgi:hypothetical protein